MDPIPTHEAQLKRFRLNAACVEAVSPTQTAGKLGIIDTPDPGVPWPGRAVCMCISWRDGRYRWPQEGPLLLQDYTER
jgi:hypothetical protein